MEIPPDLYGGQPDLWPVPQPEPVPEVEHIPWWKRWR